MSAPASLTNLVVNYQAGREGSFTCYFTISSDDFVSILQARGYVQLSKETALEGNLFERLFHQSKEAGFPSPTNFLDEVYYLSDEKDQPLYNIIADGSRERVLLSEMRY